MKNLKTWGWLGATLLYSFLFYDQSAGINFLIFNAALVAAVFVLQPKLRAQRAVVAMATSCLLTAIAIVWHPTWIAILMNVVSLMGLSGLSQQPAGSLVVAWVNSGYSFIASPLRHTIGRFINIDADLTEKPTTTTAGITTDQLVSRGIPVLVVAIFFVLYTQASPTFSALFASISLDFISLWWVIFTLFGAYLLLVFFYPVVIHPLSRADLSTPNELVRRRASGIFNLVGLRYEYRSGWLLFMMLNALLFCFNAVDAFYLITLRLPEGVTYSAFVHQGVYTLIASVVLAIAVVMYFFRGNLNFLTGNHRLKYAAYLWIAQNAILVLAIAAKNFSYISEYGLTHKRIGVYLYLLLTLIGLLTTYWKVRNVKTNWFLFRRNAWLFYSVLVVFSLIDWSRLITRYNLTYLDSQKVDIDYLVNLPDSNLDILANALSTRRLNSPQRQRIKEGVYYFMEREAWEDWQSWNYTDHALYQRLQTRNWSPPFGY